MKNDGWAELILSLCVETERFAGGLPSLHDMIAEKAQSFNFNFNHISHF
jgi:hypothetical protein